MYPNHNHGEDISEKMFGKRSNLPKENIPAPFPPFLQQQAAGVDVGSDL